MKKYPKKKDLIIKNIIKFINSNQKLRIKFNHPNKKYSLRRLLKYIMIILSSGLSYRKTIEYSKDNIHWNTIYKFFIAKTFRSWRIRLKGY